MHTCILINPNAGSADAADTVRDTAASRDGVLCWDSLDRSACTPLVEQAVNQGAECVVAAGGDGTINSVVNAIQQLAADVRLGVIPLGTGNDLARTLALPDDPESALSVAISGPERLIDLFQMDTPEETHYGINVAAGGFSGQVDEVLTSELKASWGPLAYLMGAAQVVPDLQGYETYIAVDDVSKQQIQALNIVVANGRMAAGGQQVAPMANPCDGLLDVVIVRRGTMVELATVATQLVTGSYLESPLVVCERVRHIKIESEPGMWFNIDGELITNEPVSFNVLPGRQRVAVGPDFTAAPGVE